MPVRTSEAQWNGDLMQGSGTMKLGSGAFEGTYSFGTRFSETPGTNPEELIGAAHAGCFSMQLSATLAGAGFHPEHVHTVAKVHIDKVDGGFAITKIELHTDAKIPNIDDSEFQKYAEDAKKNCPVSKALAATPITLEANLI